MRYGLPAAIAALSLFAGYWVGKADNDGAAGDAAPFARAPTAERPAPPPLTGSLRDQADRLFERIMQARARGDTAEARFFLPMALQAYEGAAPLDADGLFHVGLLQLEGGEAAAATATASRIRDLDADHLFAFALAGEAALAVGDQAGARRAFADYLARFENEVARARPEYEMHRPALDEYRAQAEQITGS